MGVGDRVAARPQRDGARLPERGLRVVVVEGADVQHRYAAACRTDRHGEGLPGGAYRPVGMRSLDRRARASRMRSVSASGNALTRRVSPRPCPARSPPRSTARPPVCRAAAEPAPSRVAAPAPARAPRTVRRLAARKTEPSEAASAGPAFRTGGEAAAERAGVVNGVRAGRIRKLPGGSTESGYCGAARQHVSDCHESQGDFKCFCLLLWPGRSITTVTANIRWHFGGVGDAGPI